MITSTALRRFTDHPRWLLWGYLLLISIAEIVTARANAELGLALHALILIALLVYGALGRTEQVRRFALALVLAPLIRLLSLSLPLRNFPQATWHPIVSIPLLIAMWMIARQLRVTRRELGLRIGNPVLQCMLIGGGLTLGALEYVILQPTSLLPEASLGTAALAALSLFIFTGFTEEIIFRGLLQSLALPVLGRGALIYVSLLFGALHIGYLSVADFVFVTIVGLVFAYVVLWSDSILGVTLAHGLTNVTLFLGLPYMVQLANGPYAVLVRWVIWIGTGLWLIAFGTLMWRAEREGRLLLRDPSYDIAADDSPFAAMLAMRTAQIRGNLQTRIAKLGIVQRFSPWLQRTRLWQRLEARGTIARIRRIPWRDLSPRVAMAFVLGGFFGILGSAGLLLVLGNNGSGGEAVAPQPTNIAVAEGATPTALSTDQSGTSTALALVATPTIGPAASPSPGSVAAASPTPGPTNTAGPTPTAGVIASLAWPETIPDGMTFVAADSWPFRSISATDKQNPFLIFRSESQWLVLRKQPADGHPVPGSAATERIGIDGIQGTIIRYADGGLQLIWRQGENAYQLSSAGVSVDDLIRTAASLETLDGSELRTRLTQEAADKEFGVTLLWPGYLPDGMTFAPAESVIEPADAVSTLRVSGYSIAFHDAEATLQIGGGILSAPPIRGTEERISAGSVSGRLISGDQQFLFIVDADNAQSTLPHFEALQEGAPTLLPPVQQGPVFVVADYVERAEFERILAGLFAVGPTEFVPWARGQVNPELTYMWPSDLPAGYEVDLASVSFGWDDFVLQGGRPYFEVTAVNPNGGSVELKGGRESSGGAFIMPEGPDVEQLFPEIRGQTATAANTSDGAILVWSENSTFYSLTSSSLDVDELVALAENLQRLDASGFYTLIR